MAQLISHRISSSFLLALLLISLAAATFSLLTTRECDEILTNANCTCSNTSNGHIIQCPSMVQDPKIKIKVLYEGLSSTVILECNHFDDEKYQLLSGMNIGDVEWLIIKDCPLHSEPISNIRDNLGIKEMNGLQFTNYDLNITRKQLMGLSALKRLILNVTELSLLGENFFMGLANLETLSILSNNIINFKPSIFAALKNLQFLSLEVKHMKQLPVDTFRSQRKLEILNLSNTMLHNITKDFFKDIKNIKSLTLNSNGIKSFPTDAFALLTNLTEIDLSRNYIRELPSALFASNKKLNKVTITKNHASLKALPSGLFANLPNLHSVDITCDDYLPADSEESLRTPENIVRINCGLSEIPHDLFANSIKIKKISLAKNKLETLNPTLFADQYDLNYLDLSHNRLKSLPKELLSYTSQLAVLNLSNNQLTQITWDIGPQLRELDLSHNSIATLNCDNLVAFSNDRLNINLHFNLINEINITCESLPEVYTNKGPFSRIKRSTAQTFVHVSSVYIERENNCNQIDCNCKLLPLEKYLRGNASGMSQIQLGTYKDCNKKSNSRNAEPKAALLYPFNNTCPQGCECWNRTFDSVLLVNCSNRNLNAVPDLLPVQPHEFKSIELHLENNSISNLPIFYSKSGYANVSRIYAAGNNISHIDVKNLPKHLIYLDISRNKLRGFNENVQMHFNSLYEIALSANPWHCDCDRNPFVTFVFEHSHNFISDTKKLHCASPENRHIFEYLRNMSSLCKRKQIVVFTWLICVLFVLTLIASAFAVYYKYQTEIKIWLYKHQYLPCCVTEEVVDKDKLYDAFICYSGKDQEFVLTQLVPELENGKKSFKLCLRVRDFIVGELIPNEIVRAIAASRRTIVLLSENFSTSTWTRTELRLAHETVLKEGHPRILVIAYGNIGSLDSELRTYLRKTTVLKWSDPLFWYRLRYLMSNPIRLTGNNEFSIKATSTSEKTAENSTDDMQNICNENIRLNAIKSERVK